MIAIQRFQLIWLLFILCVVHIGHCASVSIDVSVDTTKVVFTTRDTLVSFNFDWWPNDSEGWDHNSGILNINLKDPILRYFASQLAPAHLRVGGTMTDDIVYQVGNHVSCTAGRTCLNTTRWADIVDFCQATNLQLVFGLNEMYNKRAKGAAWNSTNAEAFLTYVTQQKSPVWGFELGNELDAYLTPQETADDAKQLSALLKKYYPDAANRPKLIAPDNNLDSSWWPEYIKLSAGYVDIYTYHHYNGYGLDPKLPTEILTTAFLDDSTSAAKSMYNYKNTYAPKAELWLGEGAAAWHSGQNNTTNAFVSGFYYLNSLGTISTFKHTGSQRQALVGGFYELLDKVTHKPNPDYYNAYLWKKLVGSEVLNTKYVLTDHDVRFYSHCTPNRKGAITLVFINVNKNTTYEVNLSGLGASTPREEYFLSAPGGNVQSRQTALNGQILQLTSDNKLPTITPNTVTKGSPIMIAPLQYGFIVFPTANAKACA